jgi:hypothetical protein
LYAHNTNYKSIVDPEKCGKLLLYFEDEEINEAWRKVKDATEFGQLSYYSTCSTSKPSPLWGSDDPKKVICVYTSSYENIKEIVRVESKLRELFPGYIDTIYYKTDKQTNPDEYYFVFPYEKPVEEEAEPQWDFTLKDIACIATGFVGGLVLQFTCQKLFK